MSAFSQYSESNSVEVSARKKPKIVIVGGGVAGLRAAQVLLKNNCDVQVLEARDRIGGRIVATSALGKPLDLGPNWIHGTVGNPIFELAKKGNCALYNPLDDSTSVISSNGTMLSQTEADEINTVMWEVFEEGVEYSQEHFHDINPDLGFYTWYEEQVKAKVKDERMQLMALQLVEEIGGIVAGDITLQSLKCLYLEKPIPGDNLIVASTYVPIIERLAQTALAADCVKLNTPIAKIERVGEPNRKQHRLTSKDGEDVFTADAIIVTVPLGFLKRNILLFEPALPVDIQNSIKNLGYGSLEKVYINFPKAFWGSDGPGYTVFLAPDFAPDSNKAPWQIAVISLAHLPAPYDQPTLLIYTHAKCSEYVTTLLGDGNENGRQAIIEFFEPYFSRLPNYSATNPDCKVVDVVATNWLNDEYAGNGSYTNFPVPLVDGEKDIDAFQTGWPEEKCWFAGEHTAPLLGLASVSGAYWSGEIAAKNVLEDFGIPLLQEKGTLDYPGISETPEELESRKFKVHAPIPGKVGVAA